MASLIGSYSLSFGLLFSILIIFFSVKNLKDTGVISSDKIKAGAAMIKAKKPDVTGLKRGGPVDMPKRTKIGKTIKPKLGLPPKRKR